MGDLQGSFTPEHREQLFQALEREMERLHVEGDPRSRSQLCADALMSIIRQYNSQTIHAGTNQPHISIHVDQAAWTGSGPGVCQTARGTNLSRETVQRLACNAIVSIITHDGSAIPLNMYRTERTFTKAQRRAIEHRDQCCRFPGCSRRARQTEIHHVTWWELGGETNVTNGVLLCYRHHRLIHEGRWTIQIDRDANVHWCRRDGTHYDTSHPHAPPMAA